MHKHGHARFISVASTFPHDEEHMTTDMKTNHALDQTTHSELAFQPISWTPGPLGLCFTVILMHHYLNIFAYIDYTEPSSP